MYLELKEGAFLVADVHYSVRDEAFLEFLLLVEQKTPPQLILMGDIFDALFGGVAKSYEPNKKAIDLINHLCTKMEVIYLEGNHDFGLSDIFRGAKLFGIKDQPVMFGYEGKKICLAHGDIYNKTLYHIYTNLIRSKAVLSLLAYLDHLLDHKILKLLDLYLSKKDLCHHMSNFEEILHLRSSKMPECDYFVEGHFHQGRELSFGSMSYTNLASFACNQSYYIVRSLKSNAKLLKLETIKAV